MNVTRMVAELERSLAAVGDDKAAASMNAYMRHQFDHYGVRSAARRAAQKPTLERSTSCTEAELIDFVNQCWAKPYREFQHAAVDVLRKNQQTLTPVSVPAITGWITTKSWWDTVDFLSPHIIGSLVGRHEHLVEQMDAWIDDDNIWLTRTAILHQLLYKEATNADRLFMYCDRRGGDDEFFIRKALGWALRQYARVDPEAVKAYVAKNEATLSGLTVREALKHLKQ